MDMRVYQPNHSFENSSAAKVPALTSSSFYDRIQCLSHFFTPDEIVDLSHQFRRCTDVDLQLYAAECRRRSLSLSDSQRSSYLSNFSRRSMISSSSTYSYESAATGDYPAEQTAHDVEHTWSDRYPGSPSSMQMSAVSNPLQVTSQVLRNQDSSYPTSATSTPKAFCFACNEHFKNKGSLTRHQKEQCEREQISACSLCPSQIYYTKERLLRHHVMVHGDKCPGGCSKKESKIGPSCKEHLSESFQKLPAKKAWGCPYCVSCFGRYEEWSAHCIGHLRRTDKVDQWSFGTMIWSLLQQECLKEARLCHDVPATSNWSTVNEKTCTGLREILEHHKLPETLRAREYWYLHRYNAVVRCIYDFIRTGEALPSQQLFEARSKPLPFQVLSTTCEERTDVLSATGSIPAAGYTNNVVETSMSAHELTDNATVTQLSIGDNAIPGSLRRPSPGADKAAVSRSRAADTTYSDDISSSQTKKRAPSLRRSLSNLALRASSGKSPSLQTVVVPPVPPLPCETKAAKIDKAGVGAYGSDWPAHSYLDPIPPHRPMSGVEYSLPWFDNAPSLP